MLRRFELKMNTRTMTADSSRCAKIRGVLRTVVVLSLFVTFLASTMAYAQAPAGPNRPAGVPEGYVITPFGYFHPSCVLRLAEGETLSEDGRVVQRADGTLADVAACDHPHYTASGEIVMAGIQPPTIGHSWIESADATTTTSYGRLLQPGPYRQRPLPTMARRFTSFRAWRTSTMW